MYVSVFKSINRQQFLICLFASLCGFTYGFGFSIFVTSIGEPGFYKDLKLDPTSAYTASIIGAVNALFAAGAAAGAITQGFVGDILGRKKAIAIASAIALLGCALCTGSVNVAMLIASRFIHGVGLGMSIVIVALYTTEVANKNNRGFLGGMTAMSLATGYVVCSWVGFGAYFATNSTLQWRLPLALGCLSPLITLVGAYWLPESPRYLVWVDEKDEAWRVLRILHYDVDDPQEEAAQAELQQITLQVAFDKTQKAGYIAIFRKPSWRKRALITIFLLFATQCTGILAIGNLQVLLYNSLGLTGWLPLLFYAMYTLIGTIPNFLCSIFMENIGRRKLLLMGYPVVTVFLILEMVLQKYYVGTTNKAGNAATVAILWLYVASYGFFLDPTQFVYISEISPTTLRAKTIAMGFTAYFLGALTFTTPFATATREIGWKFYLVFIGCNVVSVIIIYLYVPETGGLSLEEMGDLFGDEVIVHMTKDGHHIVEQEKLVVEQIETVKHD